MSIAVNDGRIRITALENQTRYHLPPAIFNAQQEVKNILERENLFKDLELKPAIFSGKGLGTKGVFGFVLHAKVPRDMKDKVVKIIANATEQTKIPVGYEFGETIQLI